MSQQNPVPSRRARDVPARPGIFSVVWRLVIYIVNDTLGIDSLRPGTVVSAALTAVLGLPLIASATEKLISALVAEALGKPGEVAPAVLTFALLALAFVIVLLVTLHRWRNDLGRIDEEARDASAKVALIVPCSIPPNDPGWLRELAAMPPEERVRRSGERAEARWLELLVRALELHGRILERLVLLVDPRHYDAPNMKEALLYLVSETVIGASGRAVNDKPEVRLARIDNANDAEDIRAITSGELQRLRELELSMDEVAVQVTTGTSAMTIGLTLAATVHRVEVQYFPQHHGLAADEEALGVGEVRGTRGPTPVCVQTRPARRRLEDALRASA